MLLPIDNPSADLEAEVVRMYPEHSPFDMIPPPSELTPVRLPIEIPKPNVLAAALSQFKLTSLNPFHSFYGSNPLLLTASVQKMHMPIIPHVARPLPHVKAGSDMSFKEVIDENHSLVLYDNKTCVLKWFISQDSANDNEEFEREKDAYSLLEDCDSSKHTTLRCFGWVVLNSADALKLHPTLPSSGATTVRALLLEHFDGTIPLSVENVTIDIAKAALIALCGVHAAYVLHGDIRHQNVLLLPDSRVVWTGLSSSKTASRDSLRRQDLLNELASAWWLFHSKMLPDKLIGNTHPDY
ncbi:unnamed protein product [Somion occarium]|uniref:Non-specific serine/threonine protein kinase n=1 Tax=Somion occarium TaxID=3059160 RepID=A0ABP1DU39_9APHY